MPDPLEVRVTVIEKKLEDIEAQPVSGSVEFRLSRQIKRVDHTIDLVGVDLSEMREEFTDMKQDIASLKDDNTKNVAGLARIIDKIGGA